MKAKKIWQAVLLFLCVISIMVIAPCPPAFGDDDPELENLQAAVRNNPGDTKARMELVHYYRKRYGETRNVYFIENGIHQAYDTLCIDPALTDAHLFLSFALAHQPSDRLQRFHIQELIKIQTDLLKTNPDFANTRGFIPYQYFAALSLPRNASVDSRVAYLKEAIRIKPDYAGAHYMLGYLYYSYQHYDLALFSAKEAARLEPDSAQARFLVATIRYARISTIANCLDDSETDLGLREAKEAVRLGPQDTDFHELLGYLYIRKGMYDLAVFEMQEALKLKKSFDSHLALGWALFMRGNYQEAWKEFREANMLQDDNPEPMRLMAWSGLLGGSPKDAAAQADNYLNLRQVIFGRPGYIVASTVILRYLALKQDGQSEEASGMLNRYSANYGDNVWGYHILQYLLGITTDEYLLRRAINRCEKAGALFFIGYNHLLRNDTAGAGEYFRKSSETNAYGTFERAMSQALLDRLEEGQTGRKK